MCKVDQDEEDSGGLLSKEACEASAAQVTPNPSLKRSANGRPPGPGRWYYVHFHRPGPGALPLPPA
ncbi:hypothetical protein RA210_U470004 [Rubrivivax sp. A210]|nr:hypothetical protein RA210_U470004 [Rubrivivax sp. A210]